MNPPGTPTISEPDPDTAPANVVVPLLTDRTTLLVREAAFVKTIGFPVNATGAAVLKSNVGFDKFIADLDSGDVVLNIHTETFPDGEISGVMVKKG